MKLVEFIGLDSILVDVDVDSKKIFSSLYQISLPKMI